MKRVLLKLSGEALAGEKKAGFDDDTINSAFEGDPENYWNID